MRRDRRTLVRWGLACGGPIVGSLVVTGSLAIGLPALLQGEGRTARLHRLAPVSEGPPLARQLGPQTKAKRPDRAPQARLHPQESTPLVSGARDTMLASVMPPSDRDGDEWFQDAEAHLKELEWQQGNMFKRLLDAKYALQGADTTMLTIEDMTGGRRFRGRQEYLDRHARLALGVGGATPDDGEDSDWTDYLDSEVDSEGRGGATGRILRREVPAPPGEDI